MAKLETPDICILGAGSAGLSVAAGTSQMGAPTMLVEKALMGGDCLNYGCVPSKSLIAASRALASSGDVDNFAEVRRAIDRAIQTIQPHDSRERFEGLGVQVVNGEAKFLNETDLEVLGDRVRARRYVVATGSKPAVPLVPGLSDVPYLTNETIFSLQERPSHLVIIGGGPIGCELGQAFRRLGASVTIVELGLILAKEDPELVDVVRKHLIDDGIDLRENVQVTQLNGCGSVTIRDPEGDATINGSHVLVAAGRVPSTDGLGLDAAGIQYSKAGIEVDRRLRTSNRRVFALGDVIGPPQLTHSASYQAGIVIRNALFRLPSKVSYQAMPRVTYTDPELAAVGLSEEQARSEGHMIETLNWRFDSVDRAIIEGRAEGFAKVVVDKRGRILGAAIVGPQAGELIFTWTMAIQNRLKIRSVAETISAYPTLSDVNKRGAGSYFAPRLFSPRTKKLVNFLARFG